MLTIKSMKHIRTSRNVRSFHAYKHATGVLATDHEKPRLIREERALIVHEARRLWIEEQWQERRAR